MRAPFVSVAAEPSEISHGAEERLAQIGNCVGCLLLLYRLDTIGGCPEPLLLFLRGDGVAHGGWGGTHGGWVVTWPWTPLRVRDMAMSM